jgi:hypothetical protein
MWGRFPLTRVIIRVLEIAGAGLTSALVAYLLGRTETPPPAPPPGVVQLAPADEEMMRSVRSDQAALLDQLRNDADARKKPQVASQAVPPQATPQLAPPAAPQVTLQQATPQQLTPQAMATDVAVSATDLANASAPAKPDKSVQASTRRDQKPERVRVVDTKPDAKVDIKTDAKPRLKTEPRIAPRAEEVPQTQPLPGVVVDAVARNVGQRDVAAAAAAAPAPVAPPPAASAPAPDSDTGLSSALRGITARLLPSRDRLPVPDQGAVRPPMPVGEFQQSAM